jgi:hypothetical protein
MSRNASTGSVKGRPSALATKSFSRYEPSENSPGIGRSRASTVQSPSKSKPLFTDSPLESPVDIPAPGADVFEKTIPEGEEPASPDLSRSQSLPDRFDELPIEIISLTDRFIDSLSARTWSEPPNIDQLSDIFQEFYVKAASHISTHISNLLRRLNRDGVPTPSRKSTKLSADGTDPETGIQQMLTVEEVAARKKARKLLEYKRILLEEAVEKRACEKVYEKIWRHKSTLDEVRDEKLRSKTAALALVGIGLRDLGVELDKKNEKTEEDIQEALSPARDGLAKMNDEKSPLGKLQHLTQAHKSIVETLSTIHPSSNSADEILPTLIYALITSPIEGINVISNLYYIQRFRTASKIDGEAAYCMTNLEAAISFLENVDLVSLRADEAPQGPAKISSGPSTPPVEKADPFPSMVSSGPSVSTQRPTTGTNTSSASASSLQASNQGISAASTLPPARHQRTLSNLLKPSAQALTTGSDAIRNTAEEGFKNISNTLDNSFKFLFGRLKERSEAADELTSPILVPKTLEEARALVSQPKSPILDEDNIEISENSSIAERDSNHPLADTPPKLKQEDKLLSVLGGRKAPSVRERSVDSLRSNGSGGSAATKRIVRAANSAEQQRIQASNNPLDSVKNMGNPLSALGGAFGSIGRGLGGIGKATTSSPPAGSTKILEVPKVAPDGLQAVMQVQPPITRFMEMENVGELRVGDLEQLLREYQRVAGILRELCDNTKR